MTVRKKEKVHFQIQRLKNKKGIFSKKESNYCKIKIVPFSKTNTSL